MSSRYHPPREVLMFNFIAVVEEGDEIKLKEDELDEVRWFSLDEARDAIRKNSTAEYFLLNALDALKKKI